MEQMTLIEGPMTPDEEEMLSRMINWVPSGIGSINFGDLMYQLNWKLKRAAAAHDGLIARGLIEQHGPCGEWVVMEYWRKGI